MRLILCSIKVLSWSSLPKKEQQQQKQNKWAPSFYFYLKVLNSVCHSFQSSYSHKIWIKFSASNRKSPLITPEHHWSLPFKRLLCLYHADGYTFGTTCLSFKNFCTFFSQLSIIFLFSTFFFFFFCLPVFGIFFHQRLNCSPAMCKTWVWSLHQADPLEEEMATHSRTLAWRIPRTEEPGGLQSTGSQRVWHWVTSLSLSLVIDVFITSQMKSTLEYTVIKTRDRVHTFCKLSTSWEGEINDCQIQSG